MKKTIKQGMTIFAVSGTTNENAQFKSIYVNRKTIVNVKEDHFVSKSIGTKKVATTQEDINKLEGLSKIMAMTSKPNKTIHIFEQSIESVTKPHLVIFDRNNVKHDIDSLHGENGETYFQNKKSAKKYFRKLMTRRVLFFIDEAGSVKY